MGSSLISKFVKKRIGDYHQQINFVDDTLPIKLSSSKKTAVVGGGLAGIASAIYLAERGFEITVFEKENFIGGKVGSWQVQFKDGFHTNVEHGFHAFFRQYYNLKKLLKKIDANKNLIPIDDYLIFTSKKESFSFKNIKTTPVENILSMRKKGIYSLKDAATNLKFIKMLELLKYNPEKTFRKFDDVSFKDFADDTNLPENLRLMFTTFSRAFFAEPQYISMAELIKSFHFYFLSNDNGLIYDVLNDDFEETLWKPALNFLGHYNFNLKLGTEVSSIKKKENKFLVNNEYFDYLILSADVKSIKNIIGASGWIKEKHNKFYEQILQQKQSQRYAVLRIWVDKNVRSGLPFFIFTDALQILDSVTIYHQMENSSAEWVNNNGGGIFELHSYALPNDFPEKDVRDQLLNEFVYYFPEVKGFKIKYEYLQVKDDFTAFHTSLYKGRPSVKTDIENLFLAGDWVKLNSPAMLMEAAATSAITATNSIFEKEKLQLNPVYSVPLKGMLA